MDPDIFFLLAPCAGAIDVSAIFSFAFFLLCARADIGAVNNLDVLDQFFRITSVCEEEILAPSKTCWASTSKRSEAYFTTRDFH